MPVVRGKGAVLSGRRRREDEDYDAIVEELEKDDPGSTLRGLWQVHGSTLGACIEEYARASESPITLSESAPWLLFAYEPFPETPVRALCWIYRDGELIKPESFDFAMEEADEIRFDAAKIC